MSENNNFNYMLPSDIIHQLDELKATIKTTIGNSLQQLEAIRNESGLNEKIEYLSSLAREIDSLNADEFYINYNDKIECSRFLGSNGWVISGHCTPLDLDEWITVIQENGEKAIAEFFENYMDTLIDLISKKRQDCSEKLYFEKANYHYKKSEYMVSSMFLLGILDKRLKTITPQRIRKYSQICSDEGFQDIKEDIFQRTSKMPATKVILIVEYIPSLIAFLNRVFVDGNSYNFNTGKEPPYLNRNWLMHGRMTREIQKYECIQLFNALDTLDKVEEELGHE